MRFAAWTVLVVFAAGCSGREPDAADLSAAASMKRSLLQEVVDFGPAAHPELLSSYPFSMLLLTARFEDSDDLRRLRSAGARPPSLDEIWVQFGKERVTLLPREAIVSTTFHSGETEGTGEFRFRREGFIEGRGTFRAERVGGDRWRIVEMGLPATGRSVRRMDDGTWSYVHGKR